MGNFCYAQKGVQSPTKAAPAPQPQQAYHCIEAEAIADGVEYVKAVSIVKAEPEIETKIILPPPPPSPTAPDAIQFKLAQNSEKIKADRERRDMNDYKAQFHREREKAMGKKTFEFAILHYGEVGGRDRFLEEKREGGWIFKETYDNKDMNKYDVTVA